MTDQPTADAVRERYAAAIRPNMLMGLQDAELDGPGGTQRINEWVDWIAKELAEVRDREMERLKLLVAASSEPGQAVRMAAQYADRAIENGKRAEEAEAERNRVQQAACRTAEALRLNSKRLDAVLADRESERAARTAEEKRARTAEAAIERVRELHQRWNADPGSCAHCHDSYGTPLPYPCPTVQALDQPQQPTTTKAGE